MIKVFVLLCMCCQLKASSQKHAASTTGILIDAENRLPIDGASVKNKSTNETATSDEQGLFSLKKIESNSDSIIISVVGYEEKIIVLSELQGEQRTVQMKQQAVRLNEVKISVRAGEQYKPVSKVDIKLRGINNSQEVLRMVPGLFIGQHAGGGKAEQIFLRGFDIDHGTDISISVDGMPVNMVSHAHGQGYADLHFLIPELIDNVNFKKRDLLCRKRKLQY